MKTTIIVIASGVFSLMLSAVFSFESDPFGARDNLHKMTSLTPSIGYASSNEDVYDFAMADVSGVKIDEPASRDKNDLCSTPSAELKQHPKFKDWCF